MGHSRGVVAGRVADARRGRAAGTADHRRRSEEMITRNAVGAALACALLLASVAASRADASTGFGIERYSLSATNEGGSADTQAGSHPYELTVEAALEPNLDSTSNDEVKNLDFDLPPGLVIDPDGVPQNNAVGTVQISVAGKIVSAAIYNLAPVPGMLARFGFTLEGVGVVADISVHAEGDHGMTLSIHDLPPRGIESVKLTLGPASSTLLALPTSCAGPLQTTVQGESWGKENTSLPASLPQLTGCNRLPFQSTLSVVPDIIEAGEPSGYQMQLKLPEGDSPVGLSAAMLRDASVMLPAGTFLSLSAMDGSTGCEEGQVGLDSSEPATCPNSSKVGLVKIATPLLARPLEGAVFLATPHANPLGELVALYLVAEEPTSGVLVKLTGEIDLNPVTGQPTLTFDELPQLPISDIELGLFGGARALLSTPATCGKATSTSELTLWSGTLSVTTASSFEITSGANGTPCSEPPPFNPSFQVVGATSETGAYNSLTFVVSRADQEEDLSTIALQAPPAVGEMFGGVPLCGEPSASEGACPATSQVGTVELAAGPGPDPYYLSGNVYLTGPYRGQTQGLSIVVPFDAGPLQLETMVVRAVEQIDPGTGQLSILSDPLPRIVDGIPVQLKALALQFDRGEFRLDPDGCEPDTVTGTITSTKGDAVAILTGLPGASPSQCSPPHAEPPVATPQGKSGSSSAATASPVGARITTNDGEAIVELACKGTGMCRGKLMLNIKMRSKGRGRRSKTVTIGTAAFSIPAGKTAAIRLMLDARARALLGAPDHRGLSATLTVLESSPAPSQTHTENVQLVPRKAASSKKLRK